MVSKGFPRSGLGQIWWPTKSTILDGRPDFDQKIDFWDFSIWPLILTVLQERMKLAPTKSPINSFILFWRTVPKKGPKILTKKSIFEIFPFGPWFWWSSKKEWNWGNAFDTIFRVFILFSFFSWGTVQLNQNLGHWVSFLWLFHREMNGISWFFHRNEWFAPPKENARRARGARRFTKSFQLMT